jgi:hypothetical protein
MANKGFLLVLMQCPAGLEDEFNAWYDTEHIPERLSVPGFETGLRFLCIAGAPRYLAMYDLASLDVLDSPEYARVSGSNNSPWTRRVTSRVRVYRSVGHQIYPGNALTRRCARVTLLRFSGLKAAAGESVVAGMRANFESLAETLQVRVLAYETGSSIDYLGFVEARAPIGETLDVRAFGQCADALDLVNTYVPY